MLQGTKILESTPAGPEGFTRLTGPQGPHRHPGGLE